MAKASRFVAGALNLTGLVEALGPWILVEAVGPARELCVTPRVHRKSKGRNDTILVRVELWPGGDPSRRREIAKMAIANASDLADTSDYVAVRFDDRGTFEAFAVRGHRRVAGVWALVARACSPRASTTVPARHQATVEAIVERVFLNPNASALDAHAPESQA
jgi:hypothetical protein